MKTRKDISDALALEAARRATMAIQNAITLIDASSIEMTLDELYYFLESLKAVLQEGLNNEF